jgi:hypothetical protein
MDAGLAGRAGPAPVAEKASMPRSMRGLFGKKKKL